MNFLTVTGLIAAAPDAPACTEGLGFFAGSPVDGATDVPTDVVPWFTTNVPREGEWVHRTVRLETAAGEPVATEESVLVSPGHEAVELSPLAPLQPSTEYRIVFEKVYAPHPDRDLPPKEWSLRFTTSRGPAEEQAPVDAGARVVLVRYDEAPCGEPERLCLGSRSGGALKVTLRDAGGAVVSQTLARHGDEVEIPYRLQDDAFCMEIEARSVTGEPSSPQTLCREELPWLRIPNNAELECLAGEVTESEPPWPMGCASAGAPLWVVALLRRGLRHGQPVR